MSELVYLSQVAYEDKHILQNLMELCQHDYSEFNGDDVNQYGLFGYRYLDHYWTEEGRYPFFIWHGKRLAGFALVRTLATDELITDGDKNEGVVKTYSMAEFFIMRKYRRKGVGQSAARQLFDRFVGRWRVGQDADNLPAQIFWRKLITAYTGGNFTEIWDSEGGSPTQLFHS